MFNNEISHSSCTFEHGMIMDKGCVRRCSYFCFGPYKKQIWGDLVHCDQTTGKWWTTSGYQPCILDEVQTTTKKPEFNFLDFKMPTESYTFRPVNYEPSDYQTSTGRYDNNINSAALFGLILAGVVGFMMFVICLRICIARSVAKRRHQRLEHLAEQLNAQSRQRGEVRNSTRSPGTRSEEENAEGGIIILRIRRYFCIPVLRNPYRAFRNSPEPPPYDAESVQPPAYEETEGLNRSASETIPQNTRRGFIDTSETPAEPPPPYTANIV